MNINYLQIGIGIIIGIVLCMQFPTLPEKLKQMVENFKKTQEKNKMTNKCYLCGNDKNLELIEKGFVITSGNPVLIKKEYACNDCLKRGKIIKINENQKNQT